VADSETPGRIIVHSSLRLFLSLDIVGSTEFKQTSRSADTRPAMTIGWLEPFLSFYQLSVEQMEAQWARAREEMQAIDPPNKSDRFHFGERPAFWKGAGDEVLFSKAILSPLDALATIQTFLRVIREHRTRFGSKGLPLDVKGTAWLAGFPVNNAEAVLPGQSSESPSGRLDDPVAENYRLLELHRAGKIDAPLDYIGPSIDLGFRLREHATPRRLILSADLAWLLCHAHASFTDKERNKCALLGIPHVGYDGRHGLKGILGGQPYPLMWIEADPDNDIDVAEDALLRRSLSGISPSDRGKEVSHFYDLFLNGRTPLQTKPYIKSCADPEIFAVPADHESKLQSIEEHVNGPREQLEDVERRNDTASGGIPPETENFASRLVRTVEAQAKPAARSKVARRKTTSRRKQ
jgi:hypothetical protein